MNIALNISLPWLTAYKTIHLVSSKDMSCPSCRMMPPSWWRKSLICSFMPVRNNWIHLWRNEPRRDSGKELRLFTLRNEQMVSLCCIKQQKEMSIRIRLQKMIDTLKCEVKQIETVLAALTTHKNKFLQSYWTINQSTSWTDLYLFCTCFHLTLQTQEWVVEVCWRTYSPGSGKHCCHCDGWAVYTASYFIPSAIWTAHSFSYKTNLTLFFLVVCMRFQSCPFMAIAHPYKDASLIGVSIETWYFCTYIFSTQIVPVQFFERSHPWKTWEPRMRQDVQSNYFNL